MCNNVGIWPASHVKAKQMHIENFWLCMEPGVGCFDFHQPPAMNHNNLPVPRKTQLHNASMKLTWSLSVLYFPCFVWLHCCFSICRGTFLFWDRCYFLWKVFTVWLHGKKLCFCAPVCEVEAHTCAFVRGYFYTQVVFPKKLFFMWTQEIPLYMYF